MGFLTCRERPARRKGGPISPAEPSLEWMQTGPRDIPRDIPRDVPSRGQDTFLFYQHGPRCNALHGEVNSSASPYRRSAQ